MLIQVRTTETGPRGRDPCVQRQVGADSAETERDEPQSGGGSEEPAPGGVGHVGRGYPGHGRADDQVFCKSFEQEMQVEASDRVHFCQMLVRIYGPLLADV